MATTKSVTLPNTIEETTTQIRDVNENLIRFVKESGRAYLDTYGAAVQSMVDFERAAASHSQIDWITTVANTHAKFVENVTNTYLKMAREIVA